MLAALPAVRAEPARLPILHLHAGSDAGTVTPYVRYSQTPGRIDTLGVADILAAPLRPVAGPTIHFGPPGQKTMVVVKVRNASATQGSWIFTTGRGSLSWFRLYEASGGRFALLVDGSNTVGASANLRTYQARSEAHTSELQSLMRISYAV